MTKNLLIVGLLFLAGCNKSTNHPPLTVTLFEILTVPEGWTVRCISVNYLALREAEHQRDQLERVMSVARTAFLQARLEKGGKR